MAWCRQATSHYLSQCWPRSLSSNGITRPQWVKWIVQSLLIFSFVFCADTSCFNFDWNSGFEIKGSGGAKCWLIAPKCSKVTECRSKVLLPIQNQICNTEFVVCPCDGYFCSKVLWDGAKNCSISMKLISVPEISVKPLWILLNKLYWIIWEKVMSSSGKILVEMHTI